MESVEEHGRKYHKHEQGAYYMPSDKVEQDRLDMQHQLFYLSLNDKLHLAPVTNPHYVLDIGTGTGIWVGKTIERHELDLPVQRSVQLEYIEFKFKFNKGVDFMKSS
jgi:hypothetical protein